MYVLGIGECLPRHWSICWGTVLEHTSRPIAIGPYLVIYSSAFRDNSLCRGCVRALAHTHVPVDSLLVLQLSSLLSCNLSDFHLQTLHVNGLSCKECKDSVRPVCRLTFLSLISTVYPKLPFLLAQLLLFWLRVACLSIYSSLRRVVKRNTVRQVLCQH